MTYEKWREMDCKMPLHQFLRVIHRYTELVKVRVIIGDAWLEEKGKHLRDFWLTSSAFIEQDGKWPELERLLEYYADVPVWNACARLDDVPYWKCRDPKGEKFTTCITVNCHFRDMRDAWYREQADVKREKRRLARQKRKAVNQNG